MPSRSSAYRLSFTVLGVCCTAIKITVPSKEHPSNIRRPDPVILQSSLCTFGLSLRIEGLSSIIVLCSRSCSLHRYL